MLQKMQQHLKYVIFLVQLFPHTYFCLKNNKKHGYALYLL